MPISADRVDPVLAVRGLVVNHGSLEAVHGIDLDVGRGEIAFLVGPNGAGKSSTLLAICGSIRPRDGSIHFNGHSIAGAKPETIVRHGIALVPEGRRIFGTLTVAENLAVPLKLRRDREQAEKDLQRILEIFPVLRRRYLGTAGQLSGGEQQQLAIGRSLLCAPSLLLVDEPSLGLAPRITEEVYATLIEFNRESRLTLLVVEQSVERAARYSDRFYVMRNGSIATSGRTDRANDAAMRQAYFGFGEAVAP